MFFTFVVTAAIAVCVPLLLFLFNRLRGSGSGNSNGCLSSTRAPAASPSRTHNPHQVTILFGSQTGTAEIFAKALAREGISLGFSVELFDTVDYNPSNLESERLVIVVCATHGEGEPTDSMLEFHEWLMEDVRVLGEELKGVKYAVFGLGDRQYRTFCQEGVVVDRRLAELGAQRVYGLGCGDASQDIEEEFDRWRSDLWPVVGCALGCALRVDVDRPIEPECRLKVWDASEESPLPFPKLTSVLEPTQRLPAWVPVTANTELLKQAESRSTRFVEFDISGTVISYQSGDHLGVVPRNTDEVVEAYLRVLGVSEEESRQVVSLQKMTTYKNVFPARVTVRTALTWYLDLAGPPKRSTLRAFAHYCRDPTEKEALLRLLRVEDDSVREFTKLASKLRNVCGFLRKFKSAAPPLAVFLEMMPRMMPRYFSISSDLLSHPKHLSITVAVVDDGLCTGMLRAAQCGQTIPVFVRKSKFHLPLKEKDRPIIMIGPGTGVAPFIGFLHRRRAWLQKGNKLGKAMLFFGCRRREEDHIYADFMRECLGDNSLSVLDVAYSREQHEKVYVQHKMKTRAREIWEVIEAGGNIYVCGDARNMARDVERQLVDILQEYGSMGERQAGAFLDKLIEADRYLKDVWSVTSE
uniref:NADPH--hemoprotein reductase n=1 Tax=Trypanosoma vivax (strain Y486) TaxID=1055687 RepID=G0UC85_TRYVY|nr:putative p450 reductase [Trypanosoma vivax Y486]